MTTQNKKSYITGNAYVRMARIIGAVLIVVSIIGSGLYLVYSWNRYKNTASSAAATLAQSLGALIQPEHIAELTGSSEDLQTPEYIMIKQELSQLVETTNEIEFAYFMGIRDGNLVFLVDSENSDSSDYSPPGQVYEDAKDVVLDVFRTGETVMAGPTKDRWGTWYNVLVPIKDPESGQIIAAFGIDYPASEWRLGLWKQMNRDVIIALFFIFFIIALSRASYHYFKLKELSYKTAFGEALYHSVFDQAPVGIAIINNENFVSHSEFGNVNMNPMFEKILGRTRQELENTKWMDISHPDDLQHDLEKFQQFKAGKIDGYSMQKRFIKPDGSYVWTYMKITRFLDVPWDNPMHLCLLYDISAERKIADSLSESERSKSVLLSNLPGMAYRCNIDGDWIMQFVSAGCYDLTGYAPECFTENKERSFMDIVVPEYRDIVWSEGGRSLDVNQQFKLEYEITTASGERKWVFEIGKGIFNEKGEVQAFEGIIFDISHRKKAEHQLLYYYEHDSATGLYNRIYLDNLMIKDHKNRLPVKSALIGINLITLQSLSATYGFNYTQELIKKIAVKLNQYSSEKNILVKASEDRFAFYIKGYKNTDELMEFSEKIAGTLESILAVERVGGGIGIYEIKPDEEFNIHKLSKALSISYEKAIGMGDKEIGICYYDNNIEQQVEREEAIKRELKNIAEYEEDGGLYLQFQPILDLKSNMICGFEALARLKTEKLGQVKPLEFIPIAEKTKLIIPIGWKITRQAFRFLNKLKSLGYDQTYVSINFSAIQLMKGDFVNKLFEMINEMQVNPVNICIEITESVFASCYDDINTILNQLRNHGLSVVIDDFGTGYSSLSRERDLNVDGLKIDKSFIDGLMNLRHDTAITSDIISIAHKLGHYTVAEGVELEDQKQYLLKYGCDRVQGYLIAKPLNEESAISLLE